MEYFVLILLVVFIAIASGIQKKVESLEKEVTKLKNILKSEDL